VREATRAASGIPDGGKGSGWAADLQRVRSSGAEVLSVPALNLIDDSGHVYSESIDGWNMPAWWGLIRKVKPADTIEGNILFDAEPKSYKLRLEDESDAGQTATVEMPLRFGPEKLATQGAFDTPAQQ
jgi:hypothetical protein